MKNYFSDLNLANINMFCYLVSLLYLSYFHPFNIRFHLFFLTTGLLTSLHKKESNQNIFERGDIFLFSTLLLSIFFFFLKLGVLQSSFYWNDFAKLFLRAFIIPLATFSYISSYISNKNSIYLLRNFFIFLLLITTIVAIFQYFKIYFAWHMRLALNTDELSTDPRMESLFIYRDHPMGLAYYSITYSYQMLIGIAAIFSCLIAKKTKHIFIYSTILWLGLVLTFSKSAITGIFISFLTVKKNILSKKKNVIFLFAIIASIILYLLLSSAFTLSNILATRFYHLRVGLKVILDNPYGIGVTDYAIFSSPIFQQFIIPGLDIQQENVHNAYLFPIIKFGWIAILPIIILIFLVVKRIKKVKVSSLVFWYFFMIYFTSYAFHIFFHNAGPFSGDHMFWIMFAYMAASLKVFKRENGA